MVGWFGWLGMLANFSYESHALCCAVETEIVGAKSFEGFNWMKTPKIFKRMRAYSERKLSLHFGLIVRQKRHVRYFSFGKVHFKMIK